MFIRCTMSPPGEEVCGGGSVCHQGWEPGASCEGDYMVEEEGGGSLQIRVDISVPEVRVAVVLYSSSSIVTVQAVSSWTVAVHFEDLVTDVTSPLAEVSSDWSAAGLNTEL